MEEDANDSAELELGPWETEKPIKKYSTIETHKKKS